MFWVMVIMIHSIILVGPPDMSNNGYSVAEYMYRVPRSGWTFPNQLHWVPFWNLETRFTRILVKEYHEHGCHIPNVFQEEIYIHDSSPPKNILGEFRVSFTRRKQPTWISTSETLIHPFKHLEHEIETRGGIAIKQGGVVCSLHSSFEFFNEHYYTSFQNEKEYPHIAIDDMTPQNVMNWKGATINTFKQAGYLIDRLTSPTIFKTIGYMRCNWDFKDIFWNYTCDNKTKASTSDVLNKRMCYVRRLCIGDWETYDYVRELYINSDKYQSWYIDPSVNISFYNVFIKEYSDSFHSGIYNYAKFHLKSHFLYFDTISQEQRRFWCTEDNLKKSMISKWNMAIILTVGITTEYYKWLAEFSAGWKSHVLKKRRTSKKNINRHENIPEILTKNVHLIDLTNNNAELIKTPFNVGRFIERYEEHNVKNNSLTSILFSMLKKLVSYISISVNEMFSTILVYFETCQYFMGDSIQESFYKRSTSTFEKPQNCKYDKTDESFYGENHDRTSRYISLWNAFKIITHLELALINIFLLGYFLKVKLIITFVTKQIMNLSGDTSHCQRGCVNKETQLKHEAKATENVGSKSVMKQLNCDMKSTPLAANSDTYENHHIARPTLEAKYVEEENETHYSMMHQAGIKTDTTSVKCVFSQDKEDVVLSRSVLSSDDDESEQTSVKSFEEHQEGNNTFISENNDDETHSNTKTRFSMQKTLNDKLVVNDSKKHWEMTNYIVSVFPGDNASETQSNSFGMNTHDDTFKSSMSFQSSTKNREYWSSLSPVSYTNINGVYSSKLHKSPTPVENDETYFVKDVLGNCDSKVSTRILEKERHLTSDSMKTTTRHLAEKECSLKIKKIRRRHTLFAKHVRRFFKKQERKVIKHNKRILRRICARYTNIHYNTGSCVSSPVSRQTSQHLLHQECVTPTSHVSQENDSPHSHTSDQIRISSTGTLSSIFNNISIESSRDDRSYHSEWMRLASFGRFESDEVHAVRLARSGWYCTGQGDQTVCFSCQRVHQHWKRNDNPDSFHDANCSYVNQRSNNIPIPRESSIARDGVRVEEIQNNGESFHRDHSTNNTQFQLSQDENVMTANLSAQNVASSSDSNFSAIPSTSDLRSSNNTSVPESTDQAAASVEETKRAQLEALKRDPMGINFDRPKYPSYAILSERVKSFSDWPASMTQTPRDMALAGFFYAGYGDYTRCFFCGGGLRNWEAGDDTWVEHARWFSKCAFVRQNKGQGFIDQVLQRAAELEKQENPTKEDDRKAKDEKVMQSEAVLCIKRMGYTDEIIRSAIDTMKARLPRGKHKVSAQEILEVVLEMSSQQTVKEERDFNTDVGSTEVTQTAGDDNSEMGASCLEDVQENELTSLELENRNLKGQLMCTVCAEKNVSIAFLPCGHLACCEDCAPAMRKCPICREFVRGTVKTFLV